MTITYNTNPNKRCIKCNGREVITLENGKPDKSSLIKVEGFYFCKDIAECRQNIDAENTIIDYEEGEDGKPRISQITKRRRNNIGGRL